MAVFRWWESDRLKEIAFHDNDFDVTGTPAVTSGVLSA
jgi:hypothetical protein